jgi:hypothetical protein
MLVAMGTQASHSGSALKLNTEFRPDLMKPISTEHKFSELRNHHHHYFIPLILF